MRNAIQRSVLSTLACLVALAAVARAPAEAASFVVFTIDNALASSLASRAGVDYVVAPGETIQLRAIVRHLPHEAAQTLVINSTAGQAIPTRQIPPSSPQGDVEYRTSVTVEDVDEEIELQLGAQTSGATRTLRVLVAPPPPSGTFDISSPGEGETFRGADRAPSTRDGVVHYQWRIALRVANEVPRASYAEWCWRSPAAAAPASVRNWQCDETRRGSFDLSKSFWWENRNGTITGSAHLGTNHVKVRPCNVRGCGTETPVREFTLAPELSSRRGRR